MSNEIEEIWKRISAGLKAFISSRVNDNIAVDDILQDVFIKIHTKIDSLNDKEKIQPWIYQIGRNEINDYYRRLKKLEKTTGPLIDLSDNSLEHSMNEAIEDMIRMMDDMPAEYCEALCNTEIFGVSQKEYAKKVGISYTAAKSRVQRARKMLKDTMMKCCHYQFDKYGTIVDFHPITCCCCSQHQH
ncbi:MAG: RNA polymerase sigma factor SigZ [Bacteroidetes bacterium HGW-Bacteroidetes-15]|nr:MAG: RNA polymerase sigma factor SigZ [Bacteroidetes bacterium HGW-Bacteroidetes-15]